MSEDIIRPFEEKMVSSALLEIPRTALFWRFLVIHTRGA